MKQQLYSIRDRKSGIYQNPLATPHLAEITRGLENAIRKEGIPLNTHTEDYELYRVGYFDTLSGRITPEEKPIHMLNLIDLKGAKNVNPQK